MTLPVMFAAKYGGPEDMTKIKTVLEERDFRSVDKQQILDLVEKSDGLNRTRSLAQDYARRATDVLEQFPPSVYRDAIISIPQFILHRTN
jgi:geranylgeranyl pyrophosphate synthase